MLFFSHIFSFRMSPFSFYYHEKQFHVGAAELSTHYEFIYLLSEYVFVAFYHQTISLTKRCREQNISSFMKNYITYTEIMKQREQKPRVKLLMKLNKKQPTYSKENINIWNKVNYLCEFI